MKKLLLPTPLKGAQLLRAKNLWARRVGIKGQGRFAGPTVATAVAAFAVAMALGAPTAPTPRRAVTLQMRRGHAHIPDSMCSCIVR
jgi:hypothetical protein